MRSLINRVLYDWDAVTRKRVIATAAITLGGLVTTLVLHLATRLGWLGSITVIVIATVVVTTIKQVGCKRIANLLWSARHQPVSEIEPTNDEDDTAHDPKPIPPVNPGLPPNYDEEFHFLYVLEVGIPALALSSICLLAFTRLPLPASAWLLLAECLAVLIGPFLTYRRVVLRKWRPVQYDPISNRLVLHQRGSYWLLSIDSPEDTIPMTNYEIDTAKKGFLEQFFRLDCVTVYLNPHGAGEQKRIRRVRNVRALLAVQDGAARYRIYLQQKQAYTMELVAWQQRNPATS